MTAISSLVGRNIIVTGGARGLGRVMALALVGAGANILVTARRAGGIADTIAAAQALAGGACEGLVADVARIEDCRATVAGCEQLFGPVAMLVNNAALGPAAQAADGDSGRRPRFWEADPASHARMIAVNLAGPFQMAQAVVPGMIARGFGRIVNISTSRTTMRLAGGGAYGPIKAAIEAATLVWAKELEGTGVTANVLLPGGPADTALIPGADIGRRAPPFAAGKGPLGQEGTNRDLLPAEIMAPPILWLASDLSAAISGRRFVARDWDPDLPADQAAARAMQPASPAPLVM